MTTTLEKLKDFFEANPHLAKRRFQYQIIAEFTGVDPETARYICSLQRFIRLLCPPEKDQHERQTDALENLGYNSQSVHDYAGQTHLKI